MRNRHESALKLLCLGLAVLLVAQAARTLFRADPLGRLKIPDIPTLAGEPTNAPAKGAANAPANLVSAAAATNKTINTLGATNDAAHSTNAAATNLVSSTNSPGTNAVAVTNAAGANAVALTNKVAGANLVSTNNPAGPKTNGSPAMAGGPSQPPRGMPAMGMPGMMMPGMPGGAPARPLPPLVKARVDRIIEKEILAPVMHPMPMALLGIGNQSAFLRATNGQTGIVKVGEDVGGLKLVRIGFNRVLVEQGGHTNELTIFNGYGSESLLPKEQNK